MSKLLRSGFTRLRKSRVFWAGMIFTILYCIVMCLGTYLQAEAIGTKVPVDAILFVFTVYSGIIMAVVCSLFIGAEYSDGTIRNKISVGQSRFSIYMAGFITCAAAGIIFFCASLLSICAVGSMILGPFEMKVSTILVLTGIGILICTVYGALFNMIAMLSSSKAHSAIICILTAFALIFLAIWLFQGLSQQEMWETVSVVDGKAETEIIKNPNYLTGMKREIYQFIFEFIPSGQAMQMYADKTVHLVRMAAYSLTIICVSNVIGFQFFRKKDIK